MHNLIPAYSWPTICATSWESWINCINKNHLCSYHKTHYNVDNGDLSVLQDGLVCSEKVGGMADVLQGESYRR